MRLEEFEDLRKLVRKETRVARRLASSNGQEAPASRKFYFSELILRTAAKMLSTTRSEVFRFFQVVAPDLMKDVSAHESHSSLASISEEVCDACCRDPLLLGWAYQFWNEAVRDLSTWAINRKDESRPAAYSVAAATQLFTEEYMTSFLCERCLPLLGGSASVDLVDIIDPACGTGHFLVEILRHAGRKIDNHSAAQSIPHLFGCDIDPTAVELARAVLVLETARLDGAFEESLAVTLARNIQVCGTALGTLYREDPCPVLRRRYGCVLTNPPYIGRRKLTEEVRGFLDSQYPATSLDLCAAFMQRCLELLHPGGALGLVTVDKWLRLKGYESLRTGGEGFDGLYRLLSLDVICELGRRSFSSLSGLHDGVGIVLLSAALKPPPERHSFQYITLASERDSARKSRLLSAMRAAPQDVGTSIKQREVCVAGASTDFLVTGQLPQGLLEGRRVVRDLASVVVGLQTSDDRQFVRYYWTTPPDRARFKVHSKGGGYGRWFGFNRYLLDWGLGESRFRSDPKSGIGVEEWFGQEGWTYTWFANGALGLRQKEAGWSFGRAAASGLFVEDIRLIAFLNSRLGSLAARSVGGKAQLPEGVVRRLPIPRDLTAIDADMAREAVRLKRTIVSRDPTEITFTPGARLDVLEYARAQVLLLMIEGRLELQSLEATNACPKERAQISKSLGPPVAWTRRVLFDGESEFWETARSSTEKMLREEPSGDELAARRRRAKNEVVNALRGNLTASRNTPTLPGMLPLEALCWVTELHPIDVWIALRELCSEDITVKRELQSHLLYAHVTECVLETFGHHWWTNPSPFKGLLVAECSVPELERRVLENSSEEIEEALGAPLSEWLRHNFLRIHEKMFFQRPLIVPGSSRDSFAHQWSLASARLSPVIDARTGWNAFG